MVPWHEYLRSVEGIAAVWLVSLVLVCVLTVRALGAVRWQKLVELVSGESGAAYSIAYVLTFPLYLWLVCLVIESSLLLVCKFGTVYAAYAASRSAIVWRSTQPAGSAYLQTQRAAIHALVPFASSYQAHGDGTAGGSWFSADDYVQEAGKRIKGSGVESYLRAKFLYARKATSVWVTKSGSGPNDMVTAHVRYRAPTWVPGIGVFFGKKSPWGGNYYVVEIESAVVLPDESAKSMDGKKEGKLGINYYVVP
jgi:hypothetical protein